MADLSTYSDIVDAARGLIQDSASDSRLATVAQMDIWANMALYEMAEYAEYIDAYDTEALTGGESQVEIQGDPLGVWRVEIDDEAIYPTTTRDLYRNSRTWQAQTGRPRWYYMDSLRDMQDDDIKLGLWPKVSGSYTLRVTSTVPADELSGTDATGLAKRVMLPLWATQGLLWGILYRFYESETRMQNMGASQFYKLMYDDVLVRLRARSFARLNRSASWGEGRKGAPGGDIRQLMPSTGFPYP